MSTVIEKLPQTKVPRRPARGEPIPVEGEGGLFTESWFAICPSQELPAGAMVGKEFLDGRVVVFRDTAGIAHVLSAYCCHLGTDLAIGTIVDNHIQCAFHHWQYDSTGRCVKTGWGERGPKNACLFKFPTVEKFGLIWAFNGESAWWTLPDCQFPDDQLATDVRYDVPLMPVDPWVVCANTPDWSHFKFVHHMRFDEEDANSSYTFTDHSLQFKLKGTMFDGNGPEVDLDVGIYGTTMFYFQGTLDGEWYALMSAFGMPRPGTTQNYFSFSVQKGDGSPEAQAKVKALHTAGFQLGKVFTAMDRPILHNIRYVPGILTRQDETLARYLELVRQFPRSHAAAEFIK
jgi:phenylpropionate dioxygenase-like ring-hydroxylating dioxygenase large terminal subunit